MTWMDFKMADTSERRVFCNTILLKYHGLVGDFLLCHKKCVHFDKVRFFI